MGKKQSNEAKAIKYIDKAMKIFGWTFLAMPNQDLDAPAKGMIIGTEKYVNEVLDTYDNAQRNVKKNS